ncbi:hypothetical protein C1646_667109 [Rhizophagus diaphanus]|nr:hypothetical protein C1646_667109 [Rhizophagus diaphanus] [Rhizophagus sp. MUCL 43196]
MAYYLVLGKVPAIRKLDYIEFNSSKHVMILRNTIYDEKKNTFSSIDRNSLILWKADLPFNCENDKLKMLNNAFDTINIKKDLAGEEILPENKILKYLRNLPPSSIHIIVEPLMPATTGKRNRTDSDGCNEVQDQKREKLSGAFIMFDKTNASIF